MEIDSYFKLVLLLGAVFTLMLALFLLFHPNKFFANRILGALAISWSISVFVFVVQSPSFFANYPHLYALLDVCTLLFFPLMFVYIRTYLYSDARYIKKFILHLLPAILYLIALLPFFIQTADTKIYMLEHNELPTWFRTVQNVFNLVIICQGIFYTIISLRILHKFEYFRTRRLSQYRLNSLKYLRLFIILNVLLWMIGTSGVFLEIFGISIPIDLFDIYYSGLTMLTFMLGVFTIKRPEFFAEEEDVRKLVISKNVTNNSEGEREADAEGYQTLLLYIQTEKPYLKNDLKMQDLVDATGMSYKRISEIFNNDFKKSFAGVINEYRIEMAISLIKDGFHIKHTLPHLAETAGFNSKTTFNRIFKNLTGQTPTEFIQSQK